MRTRVSRHMPLVVLCIILLIISVSKTAASDDDKEMKILRMFYPEEELVLTPTRHPKPLSQVAENITVITAEEIERTNAHTLKDVLNIIPGVQVEWRGGPGSASTGRIQGSDFDHALVMIDGVKLNNLIENGADIAAIPVQYIERMEIIKGPASSSWGSSLGGVVNIITKPAGNAAGTAGTLSGSFGEKHTGDYRAELSGKKGDAGYYIYAGNIDSGGLTTNMHYDAGSLYTKLRWNATKKGRLIFTLGLNEGQRGEGEYPDYDMSFQNDFEYHISTLCFYYTINNESDLNLSFRTSGQDSEHIINQISTGSELDRNHIDESTYGGSVQFAQRWRIHQMVMGMDFDRGALKSNMVTDSKLAQDTWAIFANDTIMADRFSLTPGIRYDHTSINDDFLSPSIGIICRISEKTLFRGYIARGFNIPSLGSTYGTGTFYLPNPELKVEKVWSVQAGIESTDFRYLWFKTTLFRHDISDTIASERLLDPNGMPIGKFTYFNKKRQRRQGIEMEIRTIPFYHTSLFAGFFFLDAKDKDTGERLTDVPRYTNDIGIHYTNRELLNASLVGHYIWWHVSQAYNGRFRHFIWDMNLTKTIHRKDTMAVDGFLTVHNIWNGSQYLIDSFKNPRRWVEIGLRSKF